MMAPSTRRTVLVAGAITVLGRGAARAQETRRTFRIGLFTSLPRQAPNWLAFFDELSKAGLVEGKNLIVDWRIWDARPEQYAALVADLVQSAPDVLLPAGVPKVSRRRRRRRGRSRSWGPPTTWSRADWFLRSLIPAAT
jgi:hypothetical protein